MQFAVAIMSLAVATLSRGALAAAARNACYSTATVTVTPTGVIACPECAVPTTTCTKGQPSLRPFPSTTKDCTVTVTDECPCTTCLPTSTHCASTKTVTTSQPFVCDIVCEAPTSICKTGEPTGPPATITATEGCTVSLIRKGCPGCASCVSATPTPL